MKQRGRRSRASLTVVPFVAAQVKLVPPAGFTKAQNAMFAFLAANNKHLRPQDAIMLGMFVEGVTKAETLAKKNDAEAVRSWEKAVRTSAMLATKLRISVQAQVAADAVGRKRANATAAPPSYYDTMPDADDD